MAPAAVPRFRGKSTRTGNHHQPGQYGQAAVDGFPETLVRGRLGPTCENGRKLEGTLGSFTASLHLDLDGKRETWVLTTFEETQEGVRRGRPQDGTMRIAQTAHGTDPTETGLHGHTAMFQERPVAIRKSPEA